jgi:hypothetical protein
MNTFFSIGWLAKTRGLAFANAAKACVVYLVKINFSLLVIRSW